jgi:hypothetical protein
MPINGIRFSVGCALIIREPWDSLACLGIHPVGWLLIIRLIIQTILLYPSGAVWTDGPSNVSRLDPSGADQADAEHPSRNRKVVGSNPTSGSKKPPGQHSFPSRLVRRTGPATAGKTARVAAPEPVRWRTR